MDHSQHMLDAHHDHHVESGHSMHHMGSDNAAINSTMPKSMHAGHVGHMMNMVFEFSTSGVVLFEPWQFSTVGGLIGSMIGIFIMAALYEGLKYYREYLFWKTYNTLQYRAVSLPNKATSSADEPQIVQPSMISKIHFFQTFLHMIQMVLSYFLMLIFMTYNVWLCLAVVAGAAVGYFLFGWKKSIIVDVTEHCH